MVLEVGFGAVGSVGQAASAVTPPPSAAWLMAVSQPLIIGVIKALKGTGGASVAQVLLDEPVTVIVPQAAKVGIGRRTVQVVLVADRAPCPVYDRLLHDGGEAGIAVHPLVEMGAAKEVVGPIVNEKERVPAQGVVVAARLESPAISIVVVVGGQEGGAAIHYLYFAFTHFAL